MKDHLIWAEIDLAAIAHNVRALRRITHPQAALMVAVKANGYGHGALQVAVTALNNGASALGVARIDEGVELRRNGITAPILIFGPTWPHLAPLLATHALTPSISSVQAADQLAGAVPAGLPPLPVHIKVDTGMGRLGIPDDTMRLEKNSRTLDEIRAIAGMKALRIEGVFTHFATSDHKDKTFAQKQFKRFETLVTQVRSAGIKVRCFHAANSGAIIDMPWTHMDMVRAGISVYGLAPSSQVRLDHIRLKPAMQLKSRVVHVKQVPAGTAISYGRAYKTPRATTIATIAAGYGDGIHRGLSNNGVVLINGHSAPIAGRICMDLMMVDAGAAGAVRTGDEVVLMGRQIDAVIGAEDIAEKLGTINYEVVTALTSRVPRVYLNAT